MKTIKFITDDPDYLPISCPVTAIDFFVFKAVFDNQSLIKSDYGLQEGTTDKIVFMLHVDESGLIISGLKNLNSNYAEKWIKPLTQEFKSALCHTV
jgi:hypothetical protein